MDFNTLINVQAAIIGNMNGNNFTLPVLDLNTFIPNINKELATSMITAIKQNAPNKKQDKAFYLPLFNLWFHDVLNGYVDFNIETWSTIFTFGEVGGNATDGHIYFGQILQEAINVYFEKEAFGIRGPGRAGLKLMASIHSKWTVLTNKEESDMITEFLGNIGKVNPEEVLNQAQVIGFYVPSMANALTHFVISSFDKDTRKKYFDSNMFNPRNKSVLLQNDFYAVFEDLSKLQKINVTDLTQSVFLTDNRASFKSNKFKNKNKNKKDKTFYYGKNKRNFNSHKRSEINYFDFNNYSDYEDEVYDLEILDEVNDTIVDTVEFNMIEIFGSDYSIIPRNEEEEEILYVGESPVEFILDTGATSHVINDRRLFSSFSSKESTVSTVNGTTNHKTGTVKVGDLTITDALYIPKSKRNIISFSKLIQSPGINWFGSENKFTFTQNETVVAVAIKEGPFFVFHYNSNAGGSLIFNLENGIEEQRINILEEHQSLGHASPKFIQKYLFQFKNKEVPLSKIKKIVERCDCKHINITKSHGSKKPSVIQDAIGEKFHIDVVGPIAGQYALVALDRASMYCLVKVYQNKGEATTKAMEILRFCNNVLRYRKLAICYVRCDNEFRTKVFQQFCADNGIQVEFTAPHSSYQNGAGEAMNRILEDRTRLLLHSSKIPHKYWQYALKHALFIHNNYNLSKDLTPTEMFKNHTSTIPTNITPPTFGCKIVCYNSNRVQKIFHEHYVGVFLGFDQTTKIAIVLLPNDKVIRTSSYRTYNSILPFVEQNNKLIEDPYIFTEPHFANHRASTANLFKIGPSLSTTNIHQHAVTESAELNTGTNPGINVNPLPNPTSPPSTNPISGKIKKTKTNLSSKKPKPSKAKPANNKSLAQSSRVHQTPPPVSNNEVPPPPPPPSEQAIEGQQATRPAGQVIDPPSTSSSNVEPSSEPPVTQSGKIVETTIQLAPSSKRLPESSIESAVSTLQPCKRSKQYDQVIVPDKRNTQPHALSKSKQARSSKTTTSPVPTNEDAYTRTGTSSSPSPWARPHGQNSANPN